MNWAAMRTAYATIVRKEVTRFMRIWQQTLLPPVMTTLFGQLSAHSYAVMASVIVLTALLFSLGGFLNGVFARTFDDISIVPNFILTPLTYLGGIFYSIKLLPEFWQGVSHINPILYMINAFRYGFLGITDIHLGVSYTLILLFTAGLFALNLKLLNDGYGIRQ